MFTTVSYGVFGSLGPLLAVKTASERRCLAIRYEVMDARRASRAVQINRFQANVMTDWKSSQGFATTPADERKATGAKAQEWAMAALARALPGGGHIHEGHSDGTWTRLAVTRAGDDDRDHG